MWQEIYEAAARLFDKTPAIQALIESLTGIALPPKGANIRLDLKDC